MQAIACAIHRPQIKFNKKNLGLVLIPIKRKPSKQLFKKKKKNSCKQLVWMDSDRFSYRQENKVNKNNKKNVPTRQSTWNPYKIAI